MHLQFILGCIVVLIIVLYFSSPIRNEAFGMSAGTMDQLASTHVPALIDSFADFAKSDERRSLVDPNRKPEQAMENAIQANLAKKGIHDMTETTSYPREYASA